MGKKERTGGGSAAALGWAAGGDWRSLEFFYCIYVLDKKLFIPCLRMRDEIFFDFFLANLKKCCTFAVY